MPFNEALNLKEYKLLNNNVEASLMSLKDLIDKSSEEVNNTFLVEFIIDNRKQEILKDHLPFLKYE